MKIIANVVLIFSTLKCWLKSQQLYLAIYSEKEMPCMPGVIRGQIKLKWHLLSNSKLRLMTPASDF